MTFLLMEDICYHINTTLLVTPYYYVMLPLGSAFGQGMDTTLQLVPMGITSSLLPKTLRLVYMIYVLKIVLIN